MFRIGEFSKLVRVSARMLRYYDKCGLLRPAEIDRFTGYRLYSAAQIPILSRIVVLRDMGFGVEEIEEALPYFSDKITMRKLLERKRSEIHTVIAAEQVKLDKITTLQGALDKENVNMIYDVKLKALKAENVLSLRETISAYNAEGSLWEKLGKFMAENNITCDKGGYSIYHDPEYKESDVDVEVAVPVQKPGKSNGPFQFKELDAISQAATIRFSGPYDGYTAAMEKLAKWIEENGYIINGLIRGLAIVSPADVKSPNDFLTELQVSVKKAE